MRAFAADALLPVPVAVPVAFLVPVPVAGWRALSSSKSRYPSSSSSLDTKLGSVLLLVVLLEGALVSAPVPVLVLEPDRVIRVAATADENDDVRRIAELLLGSTPGYSFFSSSAVFVCLNRSATSSAVLGPARTRGGGGRRGRSRSRRSRRSRRSSSRNAHSRRGAARRLPTMQPNTQATPV